MVRSLLALNRQYNCAVRGADVCLVAVFAGAIVWPELDDAALGDGRAGLLADAGFFLGYNRSRLWRRCSTCSQPRYWLHRPEGKIALASYGAALLLLATMKPNVAGVLIPGISVILFASPGTVGN